VDTKAPVKRKWGLREFTMFASFLCAIDCTVFPVLLTVLPAAEMLTPENSAMIHHVSRLCPLHVCMCKQFFKNDQRVLSSEREPTGVFWEVGVAF
jgi:hypothetical protein